jgi:uncharacterized repeat protein (TIGR03833 family)
MTKKREERAKLDPGSGKPLAFNPFAALAKSALRDQVPNAPLAKPAPPTVAAKPPPLPPCRVRLRHETAGRSGKVITRVSGLPRENVSAIASRLSKALGCGASVEGDDVVLQGSLEERASQWIAKAGDLRAIVDERAATKSSSGSVEAPKEPVYVPVSTLSGNRRADVRRGMRVAIVLKADQGTSKLTEGIVRDLLTSADYHPRGIKVRLESGQIGRVQVILG